MSVGALAYDETQVEEIAARFDLRDPNRRGLHALTKALDEAKGPTPEVIGDLATGVGKTFLMAGLVDYFAANGVRHILVVTPGSVIQDKTLANFDPGSDKYVSGGTAPITVVTPENFQRVSTGTAFADPDVVKLFVFNVHQLIRPSAKLQRRTHALDENLGTALYTYLQELDDLVLIADEHHVYRERAEAFSAAIRDLHPIALIGLTATPDDADRSKVVFQYTLGEAIADGHVKIPVVVYRKDGTKDERTQLADACQLLRAKEAAYSEYRKLNPDEPAVKPALFVVASTIEHATEVGQILAQEGFIGDAGAVLEITAQSSDEALAALASVEAEDSPIRAIVSVNKLREGWDVKNIAVIVALRRLASQSLTEQILGRGLRLPFGKRTYVAMIDQVDLVAHDSYRQLLAQKDVLRQRIQSPVSTAELDETGGATTPGPLVESNEPATTPTDSPPAEATDLGPVTWTTGDGDDGDEGQGALLFIETETRVAAPTPAVASRVKDAPQVQFPLRKAVLTYAQFTLSDVSDGDARAAGARFIKEVPTFLHRDALEASREGADVKIKVAPQELTEAQQTLAGLDTVREELAHAIFRHPGVAQTKSEKAAAKRLVGAFLTGAGVTDATQTAEWGQNRRLQATAGITELVNLAYADRARIQEFSLVAVTLPVEPVLLDANALDAYSDSFAPHVQIGGWKRSIMPTANFDAKSTEFAIAQILDRDPAIQWWLRLDSAGPAYIPTATGRYFPDFVALDTDGTWWVIEGKADARVKDEDVQTKKKAAEAWARYVRDNGDFGTWRYMFAAESHVRACGGSWQGLVVATNPEG